MSVPHDVPRIASDLTSAHQRRVSRAALRRRRVIASVLSASLMLQQACYNTVPVAGAATTPLGMVTVQINERGRILVGSKLGSLVDKVTGRIVRADSVNVEVAVETAEDVRGSMARWGGERFTIPRESIGAINEKKVSKWRTGLILAGVAVGVAAALLGISKSSRSGEDRPDPGNPI